MSTLRVGIIGCGAISSIYLENLNRFKGVEVIRLSDLDLERAKAAEVKHNIRKESCTTPELLADPEVDLVLNLTPPKSHVAITRAAILVGKHVYSEKPLGLTVNDTSTILASAREVGVLVGSAPDTVLGAGLQTARDMIDSGMIGTPLGVQGFMLSSGVENWHPNPESFYERGGGPMFDMGPYYLTAMVHLLGPVNRVCASHSITHPTRLITSPLKRGKQINVEVPTHYSCVLDFQSGAIGSLTVSFDVQPYPYPHLVVFGTEGTLEVPDPNTFGGVVRVKKKGNDEFEKIALRFPFSSNSRGLGVLDMAAAIAKNRPHRCTGEIAHHVVEIMSACDLSSIEASHIAVSTNVQRPAMMPRGTTEDSIFE
jgi:predicted dehydrogenase